jgi:hypothetical protein
MRWFVWMLAAPLVAQPANPPEGFVPLFNGKDFSGWHRSAVSHHGNTAAWTVENGVLSGTQDKPANGGILLTDKRYRDVEVQLDIQPDWGCDGGLFLRSNEKGQAYQVMIDYEERQAPWPGNVGGVVGERVQGIPFTMPNGWEKVWKKGEWNTVRARIEGNPPRIVVWLNGTQVTDFQDTANHAADGAEDGMIALQVHGGPKPWRWGGFHRFRNIWVRELGR